jgi:hypothetical protein
MEVNLFSLTALRLGLPNSIFLMTLMIFLYLINTVILGITGRRNYQLQGLLNVGFHIFSWLLMVLIGLQPSRAQLEPFWYILKIFLRLNTALEIVKNYFLEMDAKWKVFVLCGDFSSQQQFTMLSLWLKYYRHVSHTGRYIFNFPD